MIKIIHLYPTYQVFLTAALALVLTGALTPFWIRILKLRNIGQVVRTNGPQDHLEKQGTPTMGGLLILFIISICFLVMGESTGLGAIAVITTLMFGLLGFFDDFSKAIRERSLGLKGRTKVCWEFVFSITLGLVAVNYSNISTKVTIPFTKATLPLGEAAFTVSVGGVSLVVPWIYLLFVFILFTASANSVNLTDGLDGLAAGTVTIVMLAYAGIAFTQDKLDLAIFCAAVGGACVGFLWYNAYPADIFMGDTGSIGLGGAIAAMAVLTKTELFLILIGGIYVIETLSVIIQVVSFRWFDRRIFKMAPIHHHFELLGWSETKVMIRFWIVCGVFAGIGFGLYFLSLVK